MPPHTTNILDNGYFMPALKDDTDPRLCSLNDEDLASQMLDLLIIELFTLHSKSIDEGAVVPCLSLASVIVFMMSCVLYVGSIIRLLNDYLFPRIWFSFNMALYRAKPDLRTINCAHQARFLVV